MSLAPPIKQDLPPFVPFNNNDKFVRVDNNPNVRNAQYYTPLVSPYHGTHHPQFWKNPVTSVQMYRKTRSKHINLNQAPIDYQQDSAPHRGIFADVDWKKILFWAAIALAALLLFLGLFFLIRALLNNNNGNNHLRSYHHPDISSSRGYTGINPIYVSPIPYSYMEVPTTSAYVPSNQAQDGYEYTTVATTQPAYTQPIVTRFQPTTNQASSTTQPTVRWIPQSTESYVNPLDVYNLHHK